MDGNINLEVVDGPDAGKSLALYPGTFLIGRKQSNDLSLNDKKVSREHMRIDVASDGKVTIFDNNSSNGVYLDNKRIVDSSPMLPGQTFRLGETTIRLVEEEKVNPIAPVLENPENENFTHSLMGAGEYKPAGSSTQSLDLSKISITIGRDPSNTLVLSHPMVSRFHARIISQNEKHYILDLNSVNGTYLNGQRVEGSSQIDPHSLIQICGFRFIFDGYKLIEYDENEGQVNIEVNSLSRSVSIPGASIKKKILDNISFRIQPREFVAILGGSGAGKSTLMKALTGMSPADSGEILINGRNLYKEYRIFRSMIGYVPQEDIVHLDLTIREVLFYCARLRMPDDTSEKEISQNIDRVLTEVNLQKQKDVLVRDLSGGQRKRVSIGVELLTRPSIFILDEPTSGLDPGLETKMMEMLRTLANQGRTIFIVTHATFNIKLCDKIAFLTEGGRLAFFGTPQEALDYFRAENLSEIYTIINESEPITLVERYKESPYIKRYLMKSNIPISKPQSSPQIQAQGRPIGDRNSSFKQWLILSKRYATLLTRDRKNLLLLALQPIIIAIIISMAFYNTAPTFQKSSISKDDTDIKKVITSGQIEMSRIDAVQDNNRGEINRWSKMSMCVSIMIFTAIWFGTSNSAREIVKELPIYRRERRINLNISSYLMSKVGILAIIGFMQILVFLTIIYLFLGLPSFWTCVAAFFLITLASIMMGLSISTAASNPDKAISLVPIFLVPQIILSGALIRLTEIKPESLRYIFDIVISKWGYELVAGGILDINRRVSVYSSEWSNLNGYFSSYWAVLAVFIIVFYILSAIMMSKKDQKIS